jgi:uncharacterized protein
VTSSSGVAALRRAMDAGDVDGVRRLIERDGTLATASLIGAEAGWAPTPPIDYVSLGPWHGFADHDRMGAITEVLLAAGVSPDGDPDDRGGPLLNAASYAALDVARVLVAAGADLEVRGSAVPGGGTPLAHAVHYGNTHVALALAEAGARVDSCFDAAGVGDLGLVRQLYGPADAPRALRAAAVNDQLEAIDLLLDLGTPIDVLEGDATALHWAAWEGKLPAARHLVHRGADPEATDPVHHSTPLGWCRHRRSEVGPGRGHDDVEHFLLDLRPA